MTHCYDIPGGIGAPLTEGDEQRLIWERIGKEIYIADGEDGVLYFACYNDTQPELFVYTPADEDTLYPGWRSPYAAEDPRAANE